jgi:palmitoyl-protein thioesterase
VVPATYWHDPHNDAAYLKSSTFLAYINNELEINPDYIENLASLEKFVLVKYVDDKSIIPNESVHFGYLVGGRPIEMEETTNFIEDRLGLRTLKESGRLILLESPGQHLELHPNWFVENVIPYFRDEE